MELKDHMQEEDLDDEQMGELIGVTGTSVYRYRTGRRRPDETIMQRIIEVTNQKVTPNDFWGIIEDSPVDGGKGGGG